MSVMYPSSLWLGKEGKKKGWKKKADTNRVLSGFSLTLCHGGHTQYYSGVWEESYWSNWIVLEFITKDCSQAHTHRKSRGRGHAKGHITACLQNIRCTKTEIYWPTEGYGGFFYVVNHLWTVFCHSCLKYGTVTKVWGTPHAPQMCPARA